ncbi:MAG: T9SS type A sorting domain-containing protein [Balneola sp.]
MTKVFSVLLILIATNNFLYAQSNSVTIDEYLLNNQGFKIQGQEFDGIGRFINTGDINGDGFSDIMLRLTNPARSDSFYGGFYIIFGQADYFETEINLNNYDEFGFRYEGESSLPITSSGIINDINGDGIDELFIYFTETIDNVEYSTIKILYGNEGFDITNVKDSTASSGFTFKWKKTYWGITPIVDIGDINGDGTLDLIVFTRDAKFDTDSEHFGGVSVIYGGTLPFQSLNLSDLNGNNGFVFRLEDTDVIDREHMKMSVGDITGDRIDDVLITHPYKEYEYDGEESGEFYIFYGNSIGFESSFSVTDLNGENGITFIGRGRNQGVGFSSTIGDFNGDRISDFVIGGATHSGNQSYAKVFVAFGTNEKFENPQLIKNYIDYRLNRGFYFVSTSKGDKMGHSVDLLNHNGDIYEDLVFSSIEWSSDGLSKNGAAILIYGLPNNEFSNPDFQQLDHNQYIILKGIEENEHFGSIIKSSDINGDGFEEILIGTQDDYINPRDPDADESGWIYVVYGKSNSQTVSNESSNEKVIEYKLEQNFPNPFNPSSVISYQLPKAGDVKLEVFDLMGRRIGILINQRKQAGYHQVTFEAGNLASGIYFYHLKAGNKIFTKKMTLIK